MKKAAIELKNITKTFGSVVANKDVNLTVNRGEILSILGENGSGKTTLMNMISGIYFPDHGQIFIDGEEVVIRSPKDAFDYKIGMIHQHFKLVDVFTATENIILGLKEDGKYDIKQAAKSIKEIADKYTFDIDPLKKIHEMSVSEKQTVEIIKVLYRGADILILDEPTAVLTPQETAKLFNVLRRMRDDGKAIIIITHKLNEVLEISDKIVSENNLTTLMITHNMKDAIKHGNRLIMMNDGKVVVDISGEAKSKLTVDDLRELFTKASGSEFTNDRAILS